MEVRGQVLLRCYTKWQREAGERLSWLSFAREDLDAEQAARRADLMVQSGRERASAAIIPPKGHPGREAGPQSYGSRLFYMKGRDSQAIEEASHRRRRAGDLLRAEEKRL